MTSGLGLGSDIEKDEASRRIVILVIVIVWILVLEGAVRKWFLPGLAKPLLFLKDPIVLVIYYLGLRHRIFPADSILFRAGLSLAALFVALAVIQCLGVNLPVPVALYGLRQYWMVLPLAFIVGETFRGRDLLRVINHSLILSAVNGILVIIQSRSPSSAWINQTTVQDGFVFTYGSEQIPRASGTFSFTYGHELFTASVVPMVLTLWLVPAKQRGVRTWLLLVYSALVMVNVFLDGNRHMFVFVAWSLVACIPGFWLLKSRPLRLRSLALPVIACVLGGAFYVTAFSGAFQNMQSRVTEAEDSYDPLDRLLWGPFKESQQAFSHGTMLGEGLGLGSGGGQAMAAGTKANPIPYEMEWPRVVCETGLLGVFYMTYRTAFAVVLLLGAIPASARSSNILPLMIASFVLQILPWAPMAGNATCVYYGWIFAGFSIAANRIHQRN